MRHLIFVLLLAIVMPRAHAEIEIIVTGGEVAPTPVAVVPFANNTDQEVDVARIISDNLARTGLFEPLSRNDMLERPSEPGNVRLRNWRALGVEYLVIGQRRGNGQTRFHLIDVFRGNQILAYDMPAPSAPEQLRYTAHDISDLIFEGITGHPGVFNTRMAYVRATGTGDDRRFRLIVADADGYNPQTLVNSSEPLMSPSWAPNARELAYVRYRDGRSSVNIIDIVSGQNRQVVSEAGINGSPAWSPDGRKLAVTLSFERNPDIYVIDLDSGQRNQLTTHWGIDTEASWSPDGRHIVFTSDRGGNPQIYRIAADGSGRPERLTFEGRQNLRAQYSPDGEYLVLVHLADRGYQIALFDLVSSRLRTLTEGRLDESPSFAPNGQLVIYATRSARGKELATVTIDGGVRQNLRHSGDVQEPAWSPFLSSR